MHEPLLRLHEILLAIMEAINKKIISVIYIHIHDGILLNEMKLNQNSIK